MNTAVAEDKALNELRDAVAALGEVLVMTPTPARESGNDEANKAVIAWKNKAEHRDYALAVHRTRRPIIDQSPTRHWWIASRRWSRWLPRQSLSLARQTGVLRRAR